MTAELPKLVIAVVPECHEGMKPNERRLKPELSKQVLRTLAEQLGTTERAVLHRLSEGQRLEFQHQLFRSHTTFQVRQIKSKRKEQ